MYFIWNIFIWQLNVKIHNTTLFYMGLWGNLKVEKKFCTEVTFIFLWHLNVRFDIWKELKNEYLAMWAGYHFCRYYFRQKCEDNLLIDTFLTCQWCYRFENCYNILQRIIAGIFFSVILWHIQEEVSSYKKCTTFIRRKMKRGKERKIETYIL